jgi:TNF receptor-associated factor 4
VIRCPQKELGCEWEGELGQLQRHLNPGAGATSTQGCEFLTVECAYCCGAQLQWRLIQEHEMEACPKRPIEMQVASLMKKFEAVVTENRFLKQELDETKKMHQQSLDEMKKELVDLKLAHHQQREELREGNERVCDVLKAEQKQIEANAEVDDVQKRKITALEKKCTSLQTAAMPLPVPPVYIMVTNFNHYKTNNLLFKSDPFYSHADGYKMTLIVRPNGIGDRKGTHVSLYLHLLPGEFDDQLRWPFSGKITVQAYNRTKERWLLQRIITVTNERKCVDVPIGGGAGCNDFLSVFLLDHYLKARSLRIRIAGVEML